MPTAKLQSAFLNYRKTRPSYFVRPSSKNDTSVVHHLRALLHLLTNLKKLLDLKDEVNNLCHHQWMKLIKMNPLQN